MISTAFRQSGMKDRLLLMKKNGQYFDVINFIVEDTSENRDRLKKVVFAKNPSGKDNIRSWDLVGLGVNYPFAQIDSDEPLNPFELIFGFPQRGNDYWVKLRFKVFDKKLVNGKTSLIQARSVILNEVWNFNKKSETIGQPGRMLSVAQVQYSLSSTIPDFGIAKQEI